MKEANRQIAFERRAFSPASLGDLFIGFFFLAWFVIIFIFMILRGSYETPAFVLLATSGLFTFFGFFIGLDRARQTTFEMDDEGVRVRTRKTSKVMLWSPEMSVDVIMGGSRPDPLHGHLYGYKFLGNHLIEIEPREGWRLEDIRRAWPTFIEIIRDKDVQRMDEMNEYLEERERLGLD